MMVVYPPGVRVVWIYTWLLCAGYSLIGSQARICRDDDMDTVWSDIQPECIPESCPDFEDLVGGTIYYMDEEINRVTHIAIIECNQTFDLFPDIPDGFNECLDENTWEYPEFTCEERLEVGPGRYMQLYRGNRKSRRQQIKSPEVLKSRTQLISECFNRYEMYNEVTNVYLNTRRQAFRVMNGKFEPPMAICKEERCVVPEHEGTAFYTLDSRSVAATKKVEHGTELKKRCGNKYVDRNKTKVICDRGILRGSSPCTLGINCGRIEHPRHGRRLQDTFFDGDRITFRCNEGYDLIGTEDMLCLGNGEWRPKNPPICSPVKCLENIEHVPNGDSFQESLDGIRNVFRKVVSFSCDDGYDLIGSQNRTCQADGTWSGTQPHCTPPSCPDFEDLAGGTIYYQDEDINKVTHIAIIECNENFDLFPDMPDGFNECIDKNKWEYPVFTCEERLEVGPRRYMQLYRGNRKSRRYIKSPVVLKSRTQLISECFNRYELYNEVTNAYLNTRIQAFRVMNGKFEPPMAICKEARCELRHCSCTYTDENNEELSGKVDHGTKVTKSCNSRQEFEPENQRTLEGITHTCDRGRLPTFPRCINKRSIIPDGRVAFLKRERLVAGRLVHHGETVYLRCINEQELYNPDDGTYLGIDRFESRGNYGRWSNPTFPICKKKRCKVPENRNTNSFYSLNNGQNMQNQKVEHGTELEKRCSSNYEDIEKEMVICDKGNLRGASPCSPKRSIIPDGRVAFLKRERLVAGRLVHHGETVYLRCINEQELYNPDDGTYLGIDRFESRGNYGRWTNPTFPICKKKRCKVPENRNTNSFYSLNNGQNMQNQKVEHGTELEKRCGSNYEDIEKEMVICDKGNLRGASPCSPKRSLVPDGRIAYLLGKTLKGGSLVEHGQTVYLGCRNDQELYNPVDGTYLDIGRFESRSNYGRWTNPTFPICKNKRCIVPEHEGTAFYTLDSRSVIANQKIEHDTELKKRCGDRYEDLKKMKVICERGNLRGSSPCTPITQAPPADEYDYYYDAYGGNEYEPEYDVECSAPPNGNFRRSFLKYYEVWCNEGYTLNTFEDPRKFLCVDGKLQSYILKKEPICKDDSCEYTTDMSRKIEVLARRGKEKMFSSGGFQFKAGKRLYLNCKEKYKEPVKRVFKCNRGHWVSIQRGFEMKINNTHPECREANCGEGCKFGGTCVRDGQCSCPPGTRGGNCENPVCSEQCIQNGECIGPYQCKCELPRYGTDCETVGCDLPEVDDEVSFRDVRTSFRQDDILLNSDITCQEGYILSTQNNFVCIGNNTWSGEVNCLEGTKYTIEFKVRDKTFWVRYPGSWCPMVVTMLNREGNVIGEFSFPDGKFPGKTYNATKRIKYIGKVVRVNIALTPHNGRYDKIEMDYIRISGEDDRRYEEYRLTNVDSSRSWIFSPKLETGCIRPSFNGKYLRGEKKVYFNGDTISSSDIECNAGLEPTLNSITCQQNGQWTGTLSCSPRPELVTGLTVISSSTYTSTHNGVSIPWGPELAVDGIQTRVPHTCNCCAATNIQYEPWYKVDLGRQYDLQRVSVLGRGGDGDPGYGQFLKNMKITYGINQYAETELVFTTDDVYTLELSLSEPKPARYLELKLVETSQYFIICELQVYAFHISRTGSTPQPTLPQGNSDKASVEMEEYEIEIYSENSIQNAVYVIIQGIAESSRELLFSETGLSKRLSSTTIGPIPKIENIMKMVINKREGWFNKHIAYLRAQHSVDEYIGFLDSPKITPADIQLHKLFQLDCECTEYTPGQHGYSRGNSNTIARQKVTTEEECKSLCSEYESCKTVYVQNERNFILCKLIRSNTLSSFMFDNSYFKGTIYFRKC